MTKEKALELVKTLIATKNKKKEVVIDDKLQMSIACTVLAQSYTNEELKVLLKGIKQ